MKTKILFLASFITMVMFSCTKDNCTNTTNTVNDTIVQVETNTVFCSIQNSQTFNTAGELYASSNYHYTGDRLDSVRTNYYLPPSTAVYYYEYLGNNERKLITPSNPNSYTVQKYDQYYNIIETKHYINGAFSSSSTSTFNCN